MLDTYLADDTLVQLRRPWPFKVGFVVLPEETVDGGPV